MRTETRNQRWRSPGPAARKVALALAALVAVQYGWTLGHPFFFDDSHTIASNTAIQIPGNLLRLWTSPDFYSVTPDNWGYRPLTTFTNSVAWIAGGGKTWPYHLLKKVLLVGVCLLLFLIWRRIWSLPGFFPAAPPRLRLKLPRLGDRTLEVGPGWAAAGLAAFFAIHPANNQVVNYIAASSSLLAGFFLLLAYHLYLRFREQPRWPLLAASCASFALSILSKEEGITLPALILLTEIFLPQPHSQPGAQPGSPAGGRDPWHATLTAPVKRLLSLPGKRKAAILAYLGVALLGALLLKVMFAETSSLARGGVTRWDYFMTQWRAYLHYLKLLVWPAPLNADNLEFGFSLSFLDWRVIAALLGNLAILGVAFAKRRTYPVLPFSVLWFYMAISPASSIIPLAEPVNDHRMFLAYFGILGALFPLLLKGLELACSGMGRSRLSPASGALAIAWAVALTVVTQERNYVWSSQETLWTDTVRKNPSSGRALNNLSLVYMGRDQLLVARELLEKCEKVAPTYAFCKVNLAIVAANLGLEEYADAKFREGIQLSPHSTVLKAYYADHLLRRGRYSQVLELSRDIDRFTGGADVDAKLRWATAARVLGDEAEARRALESARQRFSGDRRVAAMLGEVQGQ